MKLQNGICNTKMAFCEKNHLYQVINVIIMQKLHV